MIFISIIFLSSICCSMINFKELWYPGLDTEIAKDYRIAFCAKASIGGKMYDGYFSMPLFFNYGVHKRMEFGLGLDLAMIKTKDGNTHIGISDLDVGVKCQLLEERDKLPDVIFEAGTILPTADYRKQLGTGGVGIVFLWGAKKNVKIFDGHFSISYRLNSKNPLKEKWGDVFAYALGVSKKYKDFDFRIELKGFNHAPKMKDDKILKDTIIHELYLCGGFFYPLDDKSFFSSLLFGLSDESSKISFISGFSF